MIDWFLTPGELY